MRIALLMLMTLLGLCCGGCFRDHSQPYLDSTRLDKGYVLVLTGIEGRSRFNTAIAHGMAQGGCPYAIEIYDWTGSWMPLVNQESVQRNKNRACDIASKVLRYKMTYPDRPVFLVGQSGGAAMSIWAAECLNGRTVDGIVLLAASISPEYRLDRAINNSKRGIVSFYSERDVFLLGFGTTVFRTMDGSHSKSAGMVGFAYPEPPPAAYSRLYQVPFNERMSASGNYGLHMTSGSADFVKAYVTPMIKADGWSRRTIDTIIRDAMNRGGD